MVGDEVERITSVVMPPSDTEVGPTVAVAALPREIVVRKISPYTNCGSASKWSRAYL